ncbi:hypothetical protein F442_12508 [Phytophthora nicotianae P10297]|uniref:Uncharacterized protein n=1 Tax=Phytophthora nicotianae P10297 TaxID=1317064 RepID=W2YY96_PHYNI|nr:hypothetical protein F442_12508 [Phytophthora nicotianae P10297]
MSEIEALLDVESEDEFLVGKFLLAELAINIDQQLEYLASRESDDDDSFDEPVGIHPCKANVADVVMNMVNALVNDAIDRGVVDDHLTTRLAQPFKLRLKPNAKPYQCKVRQNSPDKSAFLETFNKRLLELGWVYENRERQWRRPALPCQKAKYQ